MANATTRDARAGFAIYLQRDGAIGLEAINSRLEESGYGHIAQRTLTHYRNLVRAGFNRYISINRFDVARASRPYENMSTLSRYRYRRIDRDVSVVFSKGGELLEVRGKVTEAGDVGAVIAFSGEDVLQELRQYAPRSGTSLNLYHAKAPSAVSAAVIDCDLASSPALAEIEYTTLVSLAEIENISPLQDFLVEFKILSGDQDPATIDVIGRHLHNFFDLLEGIRTLLNEAGRHSTQPTYAAPPVVQEIRMASPAALLLQVPPELISLVSWPLLIALLPSWRKAWHKGTRKKREAQLVNAKRHIAELDLEAKRAESNLYLEIVENVRTQLPNSRIPDDKLREIWDSYILPSYRALSRSDVREITAEESGGSRDSGNRAHDEDSDDDG